MHTILAHTHTDKHIHMQRIQIHTQDTENSIEQTQYPDTAQYTTSTQNNTLAHTQTHTNIFDFIV